MRFAVKAGTAIALAAWSMLFMGNGALAQGGKVSGATKSVNTASERPITQLIVRYRDDTLATASAVNTTARMSALSARAGVALVYKRPMSGGAHVLALSKGMSRVEAFAASQRIAADPNVLYAQPDYWMQPTYAPNDALYLGTTGALKGQWHYKDPTVALGGAVPAGGANFPTAWDVSTGTGVVVAVIDTGVVSHADLNANIVGGYDFISNTTVANDGNGRDADYHDPGDWVTQAESDDTSSDLNGCAVKDSSWHGTHTAGTVAAVTNNGTGVAGTAFNAKVLVLRALGKCGGLTSDISEAIRWAAGLSVSGVPANTHKAQVISMSLGGPGTCSTPYQDAITAATAAGSLVVVATGNDGTTTNNQPGNCQGVLSVTAHTFEGDNASYANVGVDTKISGPGGGACTTASNASFTCLATLTGLDRYVLSTVANGTTSPSGTGYAGMAGTSMATPHVAGAAALLYGVQPAIKPTEAISILTNSTRAFPTGSYCDQIKNASDQSCGAGMLDAKQALTLLASSVPVVTASAPNPVVNGSTVSLSGSAAAQNGGSTAFTYTWTQIGGSTVTIVNANQANASFVAPTPGSTMQFRLTVLDGNGLTATATTSVRSNGAPTVNAVSAKSVANGSTLNFTVSGTDPESDTLTYIASGLPTGATFNAATGAFSWPNAGPVGSYSFTVAASDGIATSSDVTVSITVTDGSTSGGGGGGGGAVGLLGLGLLALGAFGLRRNRAMH